MYIWNFSWLMAKNIKKYNLFKLNSGIICDIYIHVYLCSLYMYIDLIWFLYHQVWYLYTLSWTLILKLHFLFFIYFNEGEYYNTLYIFFSWSYLSPTNWNKNNKQNKTQLHINEKKTRKDKEKQKLKIQTENKIHPGDSVVHCIQVHIGFLRYSKLRSRSPDAIVLNIKRYWMCKPIQSSRRVICIRNSLYKENQ